MQNHMKDGIGTTVLKMDLFFLTFERKLVNKNDSYGTKSLEGKKHNAKQKLNTIIKFATICCFLELFLELPQFI